MKLEEYYKVRDLNPKEIKQRRQLYFLFLLGRMFR